MHKRFVYFDLGNVLVTFDHQTAVEQLSSLAQRDAQRVESVVFESGLQNQYETGLVSSAEFAEQVNAALEVQLPVDDVLEAVSAIFQPNDPILPVLKYLHDAKVAMAVLSNTCEAHWKWILRQNWPMPGDWFDFHVLSYEVRSMKPDSLIYQVCEERANREPLDIFFTDDRTENIEAAQQRGWKTHLFRNADDLLSDLQGWLETQ